MNIFKVNALATQISNSSKLLFRIDTKSLITSTLMKKTYTVPGTPGSGKSGRKGPVKKTGKPLEKFGATSEESYFLEKQKEQLEKLKKELKKKMPLMSQKEEKQLQVMKNLSKKRGKKTRATTKKKPVKRTLGFVTKIKADNRKEPNVPKDT